MSEEYSLLYCTTCNEQEARTIGRILLERRLVACVNVVQRISSQYWWEGKICEDNESVFFAKTKTSLVPSVIEAVKALHSYTCPCIVSLPIVYGNPDFLCWIGRETA